MDITLRVCEDKNEWDGLLDRCPHATVFHKWDFLKVIGNHYHTSFLGKKTKPAIYHLICYYEDQAIGLYPVFFYAGPLIRYACSPPGGCPYLGPLIFGYNELKQKKKELYFSVFQKEVDKFLSTKLKANLVRINTPPNLCDVRVFTWAGYSVAPLYTYEINLEGGIDDIWKGFDKKLKQSIRKAEDSGISVKEGSKEDMRKIFSITAKRYEEQCMSPATRWEYVDQVFDVFHPDNFRVFALKKNDELIGGVTTLSYKKKMLLWGGSPKTTVTGLYPNDLLTWEMIKWASENEFEILENTWANTERLCKFKTKFNPSPSIYFSCEKYSPFLRLVYSAKKTLRGH